MDVSLAEELLLIAYNDNTGKANTGAAELDCGLAGAVLVELTLGGRCDVDGKVRIVNAAPTGHPLIDGVLDRIARERKARKPEWWVAKLRKGLRQAVLVQLIQGGVLREERHKVMGLFPVRRYPSVDPTVETAARARLDMAVVKGVEPDTRTAALASLLHACGLSRKVFVELDRRQLKARMKQIDEGQWAAAAVRKAIQSIHSAVAASTIAATSVAATSS